MPIIPLLSVLLAVAAAPADVLEPLGAGAGAADGVRRALLHGAPYPRTVAEVRERLTSYGGTLTTHIVANRGHLNPEQGSFSFFETYGGPIPGGRVQAGELYLGFFTERRGEVLSVQQDHARGLVMELIAWDSHKHVFNFWELIGDGRNSRWHYRGDSHDIARDVAEVNTGKRPVSFGARLRCSGCHTLGGPILKELEAPHNDWWTTAHGLPLGSLALRPQAEDVGHRLAAALFARAADASNLAVLVKRGVDRLLAAEQSRAPSQLRSELRSLFATMEIQLRSDVRPFLERAGDEVQVPVGFFVDERLLARGPVKVPARLHREALEATGSRFAPGEAPGLIESFHAFLVPVRSYADDRRLERLRAAGLLDDEFIADVLAVDLTTPVFSEARASLLRFVPDAASDVADLRRQLIHALVRATGDAAARELLDNLTRPERTRAFHRARAAAFVERCATVARTRAGAVDLIRIASQRRRELVAADISRNPRGLITEPGFRVIFAEDALGSVPGALRLSPATCRAEPPGLTD